MRLLPAALLASMLSCSAFGQTYTISTFAGGALPENIPGTAAVLGSVTSVALDAAGNVFFVLAHYDIVLRLDVNGVLTRVAGSGTPGFSGDSGPATAAQLNFGYDGGGIAVDLSLIHI